LQDVSDPAEGGLAPVDKDQRASSGLIVGFPPAIEAHRAIGLLF